MRLPNTAIKRPVTEPITVEDVKFKLNGATVFSVLDMNEGYHQIELDENSRFITTFHGTENKLRYTRLNFGTISAQDIFDKAMDDTLCDFILYGKADAQHDAETNHDIALENLFKRFRDSGLTFSLAKSKFKLPEVEFFGLVFSSKGVKPAASKIEALRTMDAPKNISDVRSFLGMAQYSAQFIPHFAEISTPLRALTHKNAKWKWTHEEDNAFQTLKNALSSESVLDFYEVGQNTKLITDAGPNGLGCMLLQEKPEGWKAVTCYSHSLTKVLPNRKGSPCYTMGL